MNFILATSAILLSFKNKLYILFIDLFNIKRYTFEEVLVFWVCLQSDLWLTLNVAGISRDYSNRTNDPVLNPNKSVENPPQNIVAKYAHPSYLRQASRWPKIFEQNLTDCAKVKLRATPGHF